jgi:uncharacterized protein with HEPN domain
VRNDRLYLVHILECVERIEQYTESGYRSFRKTKMIQDAVLRNLHTLTESTQRLSDTTKDAHPEIDWQGVARFRNVIVHDYLASIWRAFGTLCSKTCPNSSAPLRQYSRNRTVVRPDNSHAATIEPSLDKIHHASSWYSTVALATARPSIPSNTWTMTERR